VKFVKTLAISTAALLQACSAISTKPSPAGPSPLVVAACPEQAALTDDSMGALAARLQELGGQYRECRAAALAGQVSEAEK